MTVFKQYRWSSILALLVLNLAFSSVVKAGDDNPFEGAGTTLDANGNLIQPRSTNDPSLNTPKAGIKTETLNPPGTSGSTTTGSTTPSGDKSGGAKKPVGDEDCLGKGTTARLLCNTMSMAGVDDPGQAAMMEMMLGQATSMASQIQSVGANGAQQCANQAKLSELLAGINAIKAAACMVGQQRCESTCEELNKGHEAQKGDPKVKELIDGNTNQINKCKQYSVSAMLAAMQAVKFGGAMLQNQSCAAALSQTPVNANVAGVTLPTTTADCSDPAMASSNVQCICTANPSAAICGGNGGGSNIGGVGPNGLSSSGPGTSARPLADTTSPDGVPVSGLGTPAPQTGVDKGGGGGGGGGIGGGGGGGPVAGGGEDQGAGAPVDKQSMINGVSAGGGGGVGSPGNPNGSGGKNGGAGGFFDKFNLSKFLPSKKNFGSRGLAGMSVQSKDGITGPMGPSLWEKVTNQYQVQKPKMIQDR